MSVPMYNTLKRLTPVIVLVMKVGVSDGVWATYY